MSIMLFIFPHLRTERSVRVKINKEHLPVLECKAGLTGKQVAQKAGIKEQSYSMIKRRGSCSAPTVAALARAFGVEVEEILNDVRKES